MAAAPLATPVQLALKAEALVDLTSTSTDAAATVISQQQRALTAALRWNLRPSAPGPLVVIYDIEGTTTPLPFVTAALFPYSAAHMDAFVDANMTDEVLTASGGIEHQPTKADGSTAAEGGPDEKMVRIAADALAHFHATATTSTTLETPEAQRGAIKRVMHAAIRDNLKVPFLKTAQGMIWRHGYEGGALRGRLFDDAATAIRQLGHNDSKHHSAARVFSPGAVSQHIYSSGSIPAQLLLFRHSSHGDLTPALAGYHDPTVVGSKLEAASYVNLKRRIASSVVAQESLGAGEGAMSAVSLGLPKLVSSSADSDEQLLKGIVFVTDSLAELKAANAAGGIVGVLSVRPLNAPLPKDEGEFGAAIGGEKAAADLTSVVSFDQLVKAIAEVCGGSGCGVTVDAAELQFALAKDEVTDLAPKASSDRKSFT